MQAGSAGMEEKFNKVALWLKKILGDQPVPLYEADARTVDILCELAECNESRNADISMLIDDMKQKTAEYESEGSYLQDLLTESLNLSFSSLSKASTSYLNTLVDTALALETKDTSLASFVPAINDLTSDLYAAESKNKDMELELTNLRKKLTSALVLEKRLQDDLTKTEERQVTEKAKADSHTQNMKFLKDKSEDFKFRIKAAEPQGAYRKILAIKSLLSWQQLTLKQDCATELLELIEPLMEEQLSVSGMDASLTHESLVNLSEELAELKKQAAPLKKKLESYLDLTPCPSLARVKIEEAKRELEALEAEFSAKVDMTAFSEPLSSIRRFT